MVGGSAHATTEQEEVQSIVINDIIAICGTKSENHFPASPTHATRSNLPQCVNSEVRNQRARGNATPEPSLSSSTFCNSPTSHTDSTLNTFKLPLENNLASSLLCFSNNGCDIVASWPDLPCKMARISLLVPDSRPNAVWIDRVYLQGGVGSTAVLSVDSPAAIHLLNGNKYLKDTSKRETGTKRVCV
jgi:hypothetical protein